MKQEEEEEEDEEESKAFVVENETNEESFRGRRRRKETNDNSKASSIQARANSTQIEAAAAGETKQQQPILVVKRPPIRQPRPIRPNLRRQVIVSGETTASSVPVVATAIGGRSIELASVLPAGVIVPPKRPAHLPARYLGSPVAPAASKPNRYAWAQLQQWQAANQQQKQQQQQQQQQQGFHHHFSSAASRVLVVNPMHIVNISEHTKSRLIKSIEAVKKFSEKWFSHVLLLMFLAVYACFGAYIFISFEAPTEQWEKQLIIDTRQRIVNESWFEAQGKSREDYFDQFRSKFEEYERLLNRACGSGMTSSSLENQWNFWGALFYSMTVFTTIGYGHLTPITFAGRVATMVYAIFGIPILLMVLADLGKLLTRIIKYAFKKFNYLYNKLLHRNKTSQRTKKIIKDNTHQYIHVARNAIHRGVTYIQPNYQKLPQALRLNRLWRNQKDSANDVESLPTEENKNPTSEISEVIVTPPKQSKPVSPQPGEKKSLADFHHQHHHQHNRHHHQHHNHHHGHHNNQDNISKRSLDRAKRKTSAQSSTVNNNSKTKSLAQNEPKNSLSRSSSYSLLTQNNVEKKQQQIVDTNAEQVLEAESLTSNQQEGASQQQTINQFDDEIELEDADQINDEMELEEEEEEEEVEEDFDIPVSFALFLLVTYMMFGAVIFSIWEGWNFFDSLYFVFISMSTIGFGDLVPQHPKRMIGTFIYLLFGLALTSMCINVVQEKIHATFLRAKMQIGEKMGFDLDQIMADDYYDGTMEGDEEDCNSVAISQTNSSFVGQEYDPILLEQAAETRQPQVPIETASEGLKLSKSKESLKAKRRNVASLPGHNSHGGSLRRKMSRKTLSRQSTPVPAKASTPPPTQAAPASSKSPLVAAFLAPIKSRLEILRSKPEQLSLEQPSINLPVGAQIKGICEPLTKKVEAPEEGEARLPVAQPSRSQQVVKSLSSEFSKPYRTDSSTSAAAFRSNQLAKSACSSRKSSVSHELNQLDDLIMALKEQAKEDRFGPLLGIPTSARSSRSISPNNTNPNQLNSRRATSMTNRPTQSSARYLAKKKRSLASSPINLSESQIALDELESIKFSAV